MDAFGIHLTWTLSMINMYTCSVVNFIQPVTYGTQHPSVQLNDALN